MEEAGARSLVIRRVRQQARDIRSFDLLPEGTNGTHDISFVPGQVAVLRVAGGEASYFAIASAPEDGELEFLIKQGNGASGVIYELKEGESVELASIVG